MNFQFMVFQRCRLCISFFTLVTFVWFGAGVYGHMPFHMKFGGESLPTHAASERFLLSVHSHMSVKRCGNNKAFLTQCATIRTFAGMLTHVVLQRYSCLQCLVTYGALNSFSVVMSFHVKTQIYM